MRQKGKVFFLVVACVICLGLLVGCKDYGYIFEFNVNGDNGVLVFPEPEWEKDGKAFISIMGGKKASEKYQYKLDFVAAPNDGYRVKEWRYNGDVVKDNKSNFFTAIISMHSQDVFTVTVEFEAVTSNESK